MLKYLIAVLLAASSAITALGATRPVTGPGKVARHSAARRTQAARALTPAERRAHERVVKRIALEQKIRQQEIRERRRTRRRAVVHRTAARKTKAELVAERRAAAHRAYRERLAQKRHEAHLAHERRVAAHRAHLERLAQKRHQEQLAHTRRVAVKHAGVVQKHQDEEVAKAEIPRRVVPIDRVRAHPTPVDYVPHTHVRLYYRSPLRGTLASLLRQGRRDRREGLSRIRNEAQMRRMVKHRFLIPLPASRTLKPDHRLARSRRYTRPWTAKFLVALSHAFYRRFRKPLVITSAVRPATYQARLVRRNANAAPVNGKIASPHEYGAAVDIGKKGMSAREKAWMRGYLLPLQKANQIDVEEEFHQACFHITVYTNYVAPPGLEMADVRMKGATR